MFRSPSLAGLPHIVTMLDDIHATPAQLARHLDIKESTLATYRRRGGAPRAVMLALFWDTKWGRSAADVDSFNHATYAVSEARALREHLGRMAGIIWQLENERESSSVTASNSPFFKIG